MPQQFINNWRSELSTAALAGDGTLDIPTADGDLLGTVTASDFYLLTLEDGSKREIVKVTGYSAGTLTVTRAQEGTTAQDWPVGSLIEARLTAGSLAALAGGLPRTKYYNSISANSTLTLDWSEAEVHVLAGPTGSDLGDLTLQPVVPDSNHHYRIRIVNNTEDNFGINLDLAGGLALWVDGTVWSNFFYRGMMVLETSDGGSRWRVTLREYEQLF